jgi:hypothetical protein
MGPSPLTHQLRKDYSHTSNCPPRRTAPRRNRVRVGPLPPKPYTPPPRRGMADPPPVAASASPAQPDQLAAAASVSTPQNPNPLLSPQIPPSPTVSDLSAHISSPQQLDQAAAAADASGGGGSMDYLPRPPQLQAPSPTQAGVGAAGFAQIPRSGSTSRLSTATQLQQYAARMYGGQMSFSGGGGLVGQQQLAGRAPMLGQGQLGMLQGQGNAASAAHFGLQSQMLAQVNYSIWRLGTSPSKHIFISSYIVFTITAKDKTSGVLGFCFRFLMLSKQSGMFGST